MRITRVELIKEHQFYAYNLRLHDMVVDEYNIKDILIYIVNYK